LRCTIGGCNWSNPNRIAAAKNAARASLEPYSARSLPPRSGGDGAQQQIPAPNGGWKNFAGNLLKLAKTGENTPRLRVTVVARFTENPLHQHFPHIATGSSAGTSCGSAHVCPL